MSTLTVGELVAILDLDANPFEKNLDRSFVHAEQQGRRMSQVGGTLTRGLTLPLLAAGGAAVKLGMDFDTAFSRMVGLAGVPQAEIDGLKQSVLDLAGETAQSPQELADALYEAASAGLTSAQAMDAVKVAAQGAAAGMGSTRDIVGLVASAVASYGAANIDAARATDILTATIRAGRADPAELAGTLGRVLPVASQLGISFDQVGGAVAFLSNTFGDTNRTVTAFQGLLTKLFSQTAQGREALDDMGTSSEELQASIDERGLLGALELLRSKGFAENQQAMAALFDDMEGRSAAMALLADESGTLAAILEETAGSAGDLAEALGAATGTDGHKAKQAFVDLQVAAIQAADVIMPFATMATGAISDVANAFAALPGPAQQVVLAMAAVLAATGPLLSIGGKLLTSWKSISSGLETLALKAMYARDGASGAAGGIGRMGKAIGGLGLVGAVAGMAMYANSLNRTTVDVGRMAAALADLSDEEAESARGGILAADQFGKLDDVVRQLADGNVIAAERYLELARSAGITGDRLAELQAIVDSKRDSDVQGAVDQREYADQTNAAADAAGELGGGLTEAEEAAKAAEEAMSNLMDALSALFEPLDTQAALDNFSLGLLDMAKATSGASKELEGNSREAIENRSRMDDLVRSAGDVIVAMQQEGRSTEELTRRKNELIYRMIAEAGQMGFNVDKLGIYRAAIEALPTDAVLDLTVNTDGAFKSVRDFLAYLGSVGAKGVTGHTILLDFKQEQLLKAHSGGTVPGGPGQEVDMRLLGGETVRTVDQERMVQQMLLGGGPTVRGFGGGGGVVGIDYERLADAVARRPIFLDGRKIGGSKAVIRGMDSVRAVRDRNTAGGR